MHLPRSNLLKGLTWVGISVLCWAPMFPIAKRVLPVVDAFAMGSLRYAIGGVLFVLLLAALEGRQALRYEGRFLAAALFGVIGITGFNGLVWYGLNFTRPEHGAIIMGIQTPLTALAVWLVRGVRPAAFTLACIAAAFAGVLLVVTKGDPAAAVAGGTLLGDFLVFLGALAWVAYTLSATRFAGWSPVRFTVLTVIPGMAGLFALNLLAIAGGIAAVPSGEALVSVAWEILYFSTCTVVLGVLGFNFAVKYIGPLNTMLMLNLVPVCVFAIEAGFGRSFAAVELLGAAIVIGTLVANNFYLRGTSRGRA